jgi:hypothetical protein
MWDDLPGSSVTFDLGGLKMRWRWWRSGKRQVEPDEEWWSAVRRLEGAMKQLELDWEKTYGKVRLALASLGKRQQREEAAAAATHGEVPNGNPPAESSAETHARLRAMYGRR